MEQLMNLSDLRYGNLNKENEKYLDKENLFTQQFNKYSQFQYPNTNDTQKEINDIMKTQKHFEKKENWEKYKKFMLLCDSDIHKVFERALKKIGVKYDGDLLENIQEELGALVMRLKDFYNRPRPFQVAYYTEQPLHNYNTISGNSPAFPSGHACQSYFLMKVMAKKNPHKEKKLERLANRIANTRVVLGVHYPSDNEFGKKIAGRLAATPQIQERFFV